MATMSRAEPGIAPAGSIARALGGASARVTTLQRRVLSRTLPDWLTRFLAVPLSAKLAGANATIVVAAMRVERGA